MLSILANKKSVPLFIPLVFCFTCFCMVFLSLYSDPFNTGIGFAMSLTDKLVFNCSFINTFFNVEVLTNYMLLRKYSVNEVKLKA
ncbi:hypothetical protein GOODEAATRI_017971 [Goodea atripinnis]|uniref:Uncharacterized protein n=1 Tax=Goodea atripinnis TaxID=208336 RepID=A0ABV0PF00_9TELE